MNINQNRFDNGRLCLHECLPTTVIYFKAGASPIQVLVIVITFTCDYYQNRIVPVIKYVWVLQFLWLRLVDQYVLNNCTRLLKQLVHDIDQPSAEAGE